MHGGEEALPGFDRRPPPLRGRAPRRVARLGGGQPIRRDPLLGPRTRSKAHGGGGRFPGSPRHPREPRRAAHLGPPEPRLLRIATPTLRIPPDPAPSATPIPFHRPADGRVAL